MSKIFISEIEIEKVRHLENIKISLSKDTIQHLIITGKNGSGKTSLLDAIAQHLNSLTTSKDPEEAMKYLKMAKENLKYAINRGASQSEIEGAKNNVEHCKNRIKSSTAGVLLNLNTSQLDIKQKFEAGEFIVAYYKADRVFKATKPQHVEKVDLKSDYKINESSRNDFVKYLLDLKMTEALSRMNQKLEQADAIKLWFDKFEELLKRIFEDDSVRLVFDEETFQFSIEMKNRDPFDFNTLSSGYAAVMDIVVDLILRMEKQTNRSFSFNIEGIVLIDEIETHLHLELQKRILEMLTTIFPNVQFIITTHSPFILNSLESVAIYDLEKRLFVQNGLADIPYSGIVEGYFDSDELSDTLRVKFERYKELAKKEVLDDTEFEEVMDLEMYLEEIPDYLALGLTTEYQRLKLEMRRKAE